MTCNLRILAAAVCASLLVTGCAGHKTASQHVPETPPSTAHHATPQSAARGISKVMVFVVENHSLDQMRAQMPYLSSLAEKYGYASHYRALTHPSLGNYIAIAAGSTFGITEDVPPASHPIHGPSVFSQALAAGKTASLYAEGMPGACVHEDGGDQYAVRHNPWTYFVDDQSACARHDLPLDSLSADITGGNLPNIGMVIPNLCSDAHDCSLATADSWLRSTIGPLMDGPDWTSGRLAVVITADEDDDNQGNLVLTTVLHPSLQHVVVDAPLTHLSLSRFLSEVVGQPALRQAAEAPSLGDAFGLRTAP